MAIDRRAFLQRTCMAASFATLPKWAAAGVFKSRGQARYTSDTVLVVIQMPGGNDGLNTVIPVSDPVYRAARQRIGFTAAETLPVDSKTAFHPNLTHLYQYLQQGKLAIVQGVGYPVPDLSHFRSTDIWESGVSERIEESGWLGRTLDALYQSDVDSLHSISWGGVLPGAFLSGSVVTPEVFDPDHFKFETDGQDDAGKRAALQTMLTPVGASERDYVAHVGQVAFADSKVIQGALSSYTTSVAYPDSSLAYWLKLTAAMIYANVGPRVYWTTQDGSYDTHASERGGHDDLLKDLDAGIDAFYRDLVLHGVDQKVVVMTWSEFGRRVEDNESGGTDHGTAAPVFVLGSRVHGGFFGDPPSLTDLDPDGNLKYSIDFRSVYSSILANWIDADPVAILYAKYPTLSFL